MSLSIIIPCKNEQSSIAFTYKSIKNIIKKRIKKYQFILVNDFSNDKTLKILKNLSKKHRDIVVVNNNKIGLGSAIDLGVKFSKFEYVTIMMADLSDDPKDLIKYYDEIIKLDVDAVFGSRFLDKSKVTDYPFKKLIYNRIFNNLVKIIFFSNYNDFTNAFKIYDKKILKEFKPYVSENFNIFLELPLKTIVRKKNIKIIPIKWRNRKKGKSKFKINELSSKYIFTLLYCFFEKILLR